MDDGSWTPFTPDLMSYDSAGVLRFTASDFSAYAVSAVPEPATLGLLAAGGLLMLRRARTRKSAA